MNTQDGLTGLVEGARAGDERAWEALVERFGPLLRYVARSHALNGADAADVTQATWLRLLENIDRIKEPAHLTSWLYTTARRECLRLLRAANRVLLTEEEILSARDETPDSSPEETVLGREERAALWEAVQRLPDQYRGLMRVLMSSPAPSYSEVAEALTMPIGSIGPTRARGIEQLRRDRKLRHLVVVG